jgi:hypothetical protein
MPPSKLTDAEFAESVVAAVALSAIEDLGFRRDPTDPQGTRYIDAHGCLLELREFIGKSRERIAELVEKLHRERL